LRALAQRQRLTLSSSRGQRLIDQALGDARVGAQLDRVAVALRGLAELAPLLEPLPAMSLMGYEPQAAEVAPRDATPTGAPEQSAGAPAWFLRMRARAGKAPAVADGGKALRWLGSSLLRRVWPPRRKRDLLLGLVAGLLVLIVGATLAHALWAPARRAGMPANGLAGSQTSTRTSAQTTATAAHSRSATPSPSRATATPTATIGPPHFAVSPTSVVLPCSKPGVTLIISNSGGQTLTWHATSSGTAVLLPAGGSVGPHGTATLNVYASGRQHGQATIVFTSNGGTGAVTYKTSTSCP
jgi:hypothetical protein